MPHKNLLLILLIFIISGNISAQVTANFSADQTSGCDFLAVSFTDQSSSTAGNIVSWNWDLGNGVMPTSQNPGTNYNTTGDYTVCLTVEDDQGNTDTECKNNYISVYTLPSPDFDANPRQGCSPHIVNFEDQSTTVDGAITQWIWGVGGSEGVITDDGTATEIQSTYTIPDDYTISLTVIDENGCTNTETKNNFVTVLPSMDVCTCISTSSDTFSCTVPHPVDFDNSCSDPNVAYTWDFGNGETFTGNNPPVVNYTEPGSYSVSVIGVNSTTGCSDTCVLEDYIQIGLPIDYIASPKKSCFGSTIMFRDRTEIEADSILWDFGDGTTTTVKNRNHIYDAPGCYTISLTRYVEGCESREVYDCIEIYPLPDIDYSLDNSASCTVPFDVNFTGIADDAVQWNWDFGDGNTSSEQNPSHTFDDFGFYPISLSVVSSHGCIDTLVRDTVKIVELRARLGTDETFGCTPATFNLVDQSTTVSPITDWLWEIDTSFSAPNSPLITSTDPMPSFTLVDTGLYNIKLTVTNALGCSDTRNFSQSMGVGIPPVANLEAVPLVTCVDQNVSFTDLSSPYANSWFWEFGDGHTSDEQHPSHVYRDTGIFSVNLIAFNYGCPGFITVPDYINIIPPIAKFVSRHNCDNPYEVELLDRSVGVDSLKWDFGDPSTTLDTSFQSEVFYTYPDTGRYIISLVVFNDASGCTDTLEREIYITDPSAQFDFTEEMGCAPLNTTAIDNSIFAEQWQWSVTGGTINNDSIQNPIITFDDPGIYNEIELIITDRNGCNDTSQYTGEIQVNGVVPDFIDSIGGCIPFSFQLVDQSTSLLGTINQWTWVLGDSLEVSTQQSPSFTIDSLGVYPVSLVVEDTWGCRDSSIFTDAVSVTRPVAIFDVDTLGCTQSEVDFVNNSEGIQLSYLWDFGDGQTSTEENPSHLYQIEGLYSVCLTVSNPFGCDSTICRNNYVRIADPVANFTSDNTFASCPPLLANFENMSQNANSYEWNFGDESGISTLENPPHVYTVPGIYDVSLVAIGGGNCRDTFMIDDLIQLDGPVGGFTYDVVNNCVPTEVMFYGSSVDNYNYVWDFGDGILDTTFNVLTDTIRYIYNEPGRYVPKLILVDNIDCNRVLEGADTIIVAVLDIDFNASKNIFCDEDIENVTFEDISITSDPIIDYQWNFPGGTPSTSTDAAPVVSYTMGGLYDVTLIASNPYCTDTLIKADFIRVGETPTADFSMSENMGCDPLNVDFTDLSTINTGTIDSWNWNFAAQDSSTVQNPSNVFSEGTDLEVELIVSSDIGCQDTVINTLTVTAKPEVVLTGPTESICKGERAQLQASFVSDTSGTSYFWLADPTLSCTDCLDPIVNPFNQTTYYFISTNPAGCNDTASIVVNVSPFEAPVIQLNNDTTICMNDEIQITASGGDDLFGYNWDESRPGLSCYTACVNPIAIPTDTTTYVISVTNSFGCSSVDSVTVAVIDQFLTFASEDKTICRGEAIQLDITTGTNPLWSPPNGLSCVMCPNPVASPDTTTTYAVSAETLDFGCQIQDSVTVFVLTEDDIDAGEDIYVCLGESIQLNGQGIGMPSWTPIESLNDPNILNPMASPITGTMYHLNLTTGDCVLEDSIMVTVVAETIVESQDETICEGDSVMLSIMGNADDFIWSPAETVSDPFAMEPLVYPTETTEYTVLAQLSTCDSDTATALVNVNEKPNLDLPPVQYYFPLKNIELALTLRDSGNYMFQWSPAYKLDCNNCQNPTVMEVDSSLNYTVMVTNLDTGCEEEASVTLAPLTECVDELLLVPNAFSPNNDGQNDKLEISTSVIEAIDVFRVFDRWGALVFETNDISEGWDGMHKGKRLQPGVYVYFIEYNCILNNEKMISKGDVTIVW